MLIPVRPYHFMHVVKVTCSHINAKPDNLPPQIKHVYVVFMLEEIAHFLNVKILM